MFPPDVVQGPGENDRGPQEQILNVLTCLPFVMTGHHLYRWTLGRDTLLSASVR